MDATTQDPIDTAATWHARIDSPDMDWAGFGDWLAADPSHRAAYDSIALLDAEIGAAAPAIAALLPGGLDGTPAAAGPVTAPGQLATHYAPAKPLRLEAMMAAADEWLIGFGAVAGDATLSATGDPVEAAANLFAALHVADAAPRARIAVAPIPAAGIGAAINDRLMRAATR